MLYSTNVSQIMAAIQALDEKELRELKVALIAFNVEVAKKALAKLETGDEVSWTHANVTYTGRIQRIGKKNAIVRELTRDDGQLSAPRKWTVSPTLLRLVIHTKEEAAA